MTKKMDYQIIRMNQNTWRIEDSGVRFFLLTGTAEEVFGKTIIADDPETGTGFRDFSER